jgi:protein-tyrosine-phosphatase/putative NADPH-quinone reductase
MEREDRKNMFVLALQGSPRLKGNTSLLVSAFMEKAESLGAKTLKIDVARKKIAPCIECGTCEKEGFCSIDDDMQEMYFWLWEADIVVLASPVFFYGVTAQLKALVDRSQALWARKYVHGVADPGRRWRQGCLLSVGATKGKNLFDGISLTAKYFFDAVGANFDERLVYRKVEGAGDIKDHATALSEAGILAENMVSPLIQRKRVLFVSQEDAFRGQVASAFAQHQGGDRLEVQSAGISPAESLSTAAAEIMGEKGLDLAYRRPQSLEEAGRLMAPELIVSIGNDKQFPRFPGASVEGWHLPGPAGHSPDSLRQVRDDLEKRVTALVSEIN